jgi:surfactin synthase thioesterase subunit
VAGSAGAFVGAVTLVCVPLCGGQAGGVVPLARALSGVNVVAAQWPGHGRRLRETPLTSVADIVQGLAAAVVASVDAPCVLHGQHGWLVGVELVRALQEGERRAGGLHRLRVPGAL